MEKNSIYTVSEELLENFRRILQSMEIESEPFVLGRPGALRQMIDETLVSPQALANLENLNDWLAGLIPQIRRREARRPKPETARGASAGDGKRHTDAVEDAAEPLREEIRRLEAANKQALAECAALREQAEKDAAASRKREEDAGQKAAFVREIIAVRDNIAMREELLKREPGYENSSAGKILNLFKKDTERILANYGAAPLNRPGRFDPALQKAVETAACETPDLHDTVAETFREGYTMDGAVLRFQEVVLYRFQERGS